MLPADHDDNPLIVYGRRAEGELAVAVLDRNGRPWFVFSAKSPAPFDEMDARWVERLFKAFQTIERPAQPLP